MWTIRNGSRCTLRLQSQFTDEQWVRQPASEIPAGHEVTFAARASGMMNGVEGKVVYDVEVPDDGPVCAAIHLTFEVPVFGYSKFTKRSPAYIALRMQNNTGNHPHVQLLVVDDESGNEQRNQEVLRYIQQQEAGFERIRRSFVQQSSVPIANPRLITVTGQPVAQAPMGVAVVDGTFGPPPVQQQQQFGMMSRGHAEVHPEPPPVLVAKDHAAQMNENARLLTEMLANNTVGSEADFVQELLVDCRRQMRMAHGMLENVTDEEDMMTLLGANDTLAGAVEQCNEKMKQQEEEPESLLSS